MTKPPSHQFFPGSLNGTAPYRSRTNPLRWKAKFPLGLHRGGTVVSVEARLFLLGNHRFSMSFSLGDTAQPALTKGRKRRQTAVKRFFFFTEFFGWFLLTS
jgi:hypothetical protein